ncbi:MAG: shikimate kinase [bacterium]
MIFYLIGMMGSGKSSVGKLLANKLQFSIIDIDKEIEKNEKLSIKEIFEEKGENYFREIESKYLLRKRNSAVVSCGGGIILNKKNREFLRTNGYTIYLKSSIPTLEKRLLNKSSRPLLNNDNLKETLINIYSKRKTLYTSAANTTIITDRRSVKEVCELIIKKLKIEKIYS